MDNAMTDSALFMSSSRAIVLRAGAMIVDTIIRLKPVAERTSVTVHFLTVGQSFGLDKANRRVLAWMSRLHQFELTNFSASYVASKQIKYGSSRFVLDSCAAVISILGRASGSIDPLSDPAAMISWLVVSNGWIGGMLLRTTIKTKSGQR